MTHPRLEAPAIRKPTNGTNGRGAAVLPKAGGGPGRAREKRASREQADCPIIEKSRAWILALKGGVVLSLATFALVAMAPGLSRPVLGSRDAGAVAYSFGFAPADSDRLSNGATAAVWPLEHEPGSGSASLTPPRGGPGALPASPAEEGRAEPAKEVAARSAAEAGTAARLDERGSRERRPQGPSAARPETGGGIAKQTNAGKRRTSVAIEQEKIIAKPAAPKPRLLTTEPEATFRPKPVYPPTALKNEMEGVVRVKFLVTTTGSVKSLEVLWAQPPGEFEAAIKEAVTQWRFVPGKDQDGKPMEAEQVYNYVFKLEAPGA